MISGRGRGKIRPPRRVLTQQNTDFQSLWETLRHALQQIHSKNASQLSFEQLYRASYKIVLKKNGELLYLHVKAFEEEWFGNEVMIRIRALISRNLLGIALGASSVTTANERRSTGEKFLKGLKQAWEDHILCMSMTSDILMYMDRVYCNENRKASIFTTAMGLFRDHILRSKLSNVNVDFITFDILNSVLLDQIQMEREGDVIDKGLIRSCMYMLEGLYETDDENENEKLYLTVFEPAFLKASQKFYENECLLLLRESDAGTWLRQTQRRLKEEADRCGTTISPLTDAKICKVVEAELISKHLEDFVALEGSGVKAMIDNDRLEDLSLLYQHIMRVDETKTALKKALRSRVVVLGTEVNKSILATNFAAPPAVPADGAVENAEKIKSPTLSAQQTLAAIKWVDEVLTLKDKFDTMWVKCFREDITIQSALTASFSEFINAFGRSPEYVSLFIDDNLKRGIKGKTEAEVDIVLEKATTLLRYIKDKDMFELYYNKHLARRLLHGKSESVDVEKQMISRMKIEIGSHFTFKLEGMFKDMTMSQELTSGYRQHIQGLGEIDKKQIDLGVSVLTTNFWPMDSMAGSSSRAEDRTLIRCNWPPELKTLMDSFTTYYLRERNGRRLTWLAFSGNADIRCVFPKISGKEGILGRERRHEISVSTYGMLVLLLFNDLAQGESLLLEEIQDQTKIPTLELNKVLASLSLSPKARILVKDPMTKSFKSGDKFSFNDSFSSKAVKVKIPIVMGLNKVEGEEERKETESKNDEMRGGVIEAGIVRIMKQRKELQHAKLISELIIQLSSRFKPDVTMAKKRIESLIEREYLERIEGAEPPAYRYLA